MIVSLLLDWREEEEEEEEENEENELLLLLEAAVALHETRRSRPPSGRQKSHTCYFVFVRRED